MVYNIPFMEVWVTFSTAVTPAKAHTSTVLSLVFSVDLLLAIALGKKKKSSSLNTPSPNLFFLVFFTFYVQMSTAPSRIPIPALSFPSPRDNKC